MDLENGDEHNYVMMKGSKNYEKKWHPFHDIPWKIYTYRALSAWDDRLWLFGAGVFMVNLYPDNLRLVGFYGLVLNLSVIIFGAYIGKWIDKTQRLKAAKTFLSIQNLFTAVNCILLALYFAKVGESSWPYWIPTFAQYMTIILATFGHLGSVGSKIMIEKDWIVVVSRNNDDRLAQINSVFTTIDLITISIGPLMAGLVFEFGDNYAAAVFIAIFNLLTLIIQYLLLKSIYEEFPALAHKKIFEQETVDENVANDSIKSLILTWFNGLKLYITYPTFTAGFGLACLYMTVLGFDNITYGYILHQCVSESVLGGLVSASAIVGISGSIAFPFLRKSIGLVKTGIVGFFSLISCLTLCVVSVFMLGSPFDPNYIPHSDIAVQNISNSNLTTAMVSSNLTMNQTIKEENDLENCITPSYLSVGVLLAGIIMAKFGLWISDITVTQILQEKVIEEHRGIIGGVQNGMNSAMDTIKFGLVVILPEDETFGWIVMTSFIFVCFGGISYICYAVLEKGAIAIGTNEVVNIEESDEADRENVGG